MITLSPAPKWNNGTRKKLREETQEAREAKKKTLKRGAAIFYPHIPSPLLWKQMRKISSMRWSCIRWSVPFALRRRR